LPIESHLPIHLRLFCREIAVAEKSRSKVQASLEGGSQVCNVRSPRYPLETHKPFKSDKASPPYLTSLRLSSIIPRLSWEMVQLSRPGLASFCDIIIKLDLFIYLDD